MASNRLVVCFLASLLITELAGIFLAMWVLFEHRTAFGLTFSTTFLFGSFLTIMLFIFANLAEERESRRASASSTR